MSHYWKKCPHCRRTVEDGYGYPRQELGNPYRSCRFCSSIYKDRHVIEWENASIFKKVMFYLGNGRLLCNIFVSFFLFQYLKNCTDVKMWLTITLTSLTFVSIFIACTIFVRHQVKEYMEDIEEPCKDHYSKYVGDPFALGKYKDKK